MSDLIPTVVTVEITTSLVPSPVQCDLVLPPDGPTGTALPLVIALHGGGGGDGFAEILTPLITRAWLNAELEPCVLAVPKSGRSFWIDDIRGEARWETFVLEELSIGVAAHVALDGRVALIGVSMGGLGVLRLALKHPDRYVAVAALEPGIESAMTWEDVDIQSTGVRDAALFERFHGSPVDPRHFALNHPPALVAPQAEAIRSSGLALYIECGEDDALGLDQGAELMHHLLQEHRVRHEYHLVLGADHIGRTLPRRFAEAMAFLGRSLRPEGPDPAANGFRGMLGLPDLRVRRGSATIGLRVRGSGPTVVMVPSLGRTGLDFGTLASQLDAAGYQAVSVDPRGLDGLGLDGELTLHDLAADVAAGIDALGTGAVHLVGHALGNRISRTVTADRPDLVASLTLLAAGGLVAPDESVHASLLACFDLESPDSVHRAHIANAFFATDEVPPEWVAGWHPSVAGAQGRAVGATDRDDWWGGRAPATLVIQGLQDRVAVPENGRRYVADLGESATLVEIDGAGHALLPEQPALVAEALIAFLDRVTATATATATATE
jgi:S-formylglutathione hydrolase